MEVGSQEYIIGAFIVVAVAVTGAFIAVNGSGGDIDSSQSAATDWKEVPLTDVSTEEEYTISELDKPVLVETFAVWCPTCTRQQQEVGKYHDQSNVSSVSLNTDPNEDASKIQQHIEDNGFNWKYSVAPPELTNPLVEEHGQVMLNPPSAPMVLVCENGTRKLPTGVKPVSKLEQEVEQGC